MLPGESITTSEHSIANPSALGLLGFGMTTFILALHNVGMFGFDSTILAMGIFYGGIAQIIAGLIDFKRNNMFGATAFTSYGFFWIILVTVKLDILGAGVSETSAMSAFFVIWGMLTLAFLIGILKGRISLKIVFLTLTALFFVLALGTSLDSETIMKIAGVVGIVCGGSAMYTAYAEILNEQYGRPVLPF